MKEEGAIRMQSSEDREALLLTRHIMNLAANLVRETGGDQALRENPELLNNFGKAVHEVTSGSLLGISKILRWYEKRGIDMNIAKENQGTDRAVYHPDCSACLRGRPHSQLEHEQALRRAWAASRADYGE